MLTKEEEEEEEREYKRHNVGNRHWSGRKESRVKTTVEDVVKVFIGEERTS